MEALNWHLKSNRLKVIQHENRPTCLRLGSVDTVLYY